MNRKSWMAIWMTVALIFCTAAAAETEFANWNQQAVFDAVRWSADFPKDAHVVRAMEYLCKVEEHQVRVMLMEVSQNPHIETMFGTSARLAMLDLETGNLTTYANFEWPESWKLDSREDALNLIYCGWISYADGSNSQIWADHELVFPLEEQDVQAVNLALDSVFSR